MSLPVPTDAERCAAALAALDLGPGRLRRVLEGRTPEQALEALATGTHPEDPDGRSRELVRHDAADVAARRCEAAGVHVLLLGSAGYPSALAADAEAPAVLFVRGEARVLEGRPRVAVVGTRSATAVGLQAAADMGRTLAAAGVVVVSGLAVGVDSAALRGALEPTDGAPPVAVLGTAHNGRATAGQRAIDDRIAGRGAVLSEQAPGSVGARWRFATRNRIMAALAQLVVVVECHSEGGALHTVRAARRRDVPVAAVPGSLESAAAAGTNAMLVDGARCVRHGTDVLDLLDRITGTRHRPRAGPTTSVGPPAAGRRAVRLEPTTSSVLAALGPEPCDLNAVVERSRQPFGVVALALEQLSDLRLAEGTGGWWRRLPTSRRRG